MVRLVLNDSFEGSDVPTDDLDLAGQIAEAWRRERPGTPVESIGVVTRIWAVGKLLRENRQRVLAALGIDDSTLDLLSTLRRAGPPYTLTTRQITERTLVTAGAISQRLGRAERAGLVVRRPDVGSRAVWVELTAKGHEVIEASVDHLLSQELEQLSALTPEQRSTLAELLRLLLGDLQRRFAGDTPSE
jgi:DNA-binding MarR family transcriptional regulator